MKRNLLYLLIVLASIPVLYFVEYHFSDTRQQKMNMQIAEDFIPIVQKALDGDIRFSKIELFSYTNYMGSLGVGGSIRAEDVEELKRRVEGTSPQVKVAWLMDVLDETVSPATTQTKDRAPATRQ